MVSKSFTLKSMPKIYMSAVSGSSRIEIIDSDVLSSVTSTGMETTAIMDLSILKSILGVLGNPHTMIAFTAWLGAAFLTLSLTPCLLDGSLESILGG
jgi:hypothetical protein